ncbi:hypothetical protein SAMN05216571_101382 [Onishia taeanensis]|uniref:Uncharacterized protein n=1 Tax=Onishia taeanensis TaxID=284577 RepID=A0A1G7NDY1_9GAMM|nr:hypothetical protein SAMN05216571_101382 [Halomonas taeanensis]
MNQGISTLEHWQVEPELGGGIGQLQRVCCEAAELRRKDNEAQAHETELLAEISECRQQLGIPHSSIRRPGEDGAGSLDTSRYLTDRSGRPPQPAQEE